MIGAPKLDKKVVVLYKIISICFIPFEKIQRKPKGWDFKTEQAIEGIKWNH